jgi:ATP/maltotriose-dependent transcriptional regulator MalT
MNMSAASTMGRLARADRGKAPAPAVLLSTISSFGAAGPALRRFDDPLKGLVDIAQHRLAVQRLGMMDRNLTGATAARSRACLRRAWGLLSQLRIEPALSLASSIEPGLADLDEGEASDLERELGYVRAAAFTLADQSERAWPLVLRCLDQADPGWSPLATGLARLGAWRAGDLEAFHGLGRPSLERNADRRGRHILVFDRAMEAALEAQQLRFASARRLGEDALQLAGEGAARGADLFPAAVLADLAYEEGRLDLAWSLLEPRLPLVRSHGSLECAIRVYPRLSQIAQVRGQIQYAATLLREGELLGQARGWPRLAAACLHARFELFHLEGRLDDARSCAGDLERLVSVACGDGQMNPGAYAALAAARLELESGVDSRAVATIRQLHHSAIARQDLYTGLALSVRLIDALCAIGQTEEAAVLLCRVLEVGVQTGLYQTLLDSGPRVRSLLEALFAGGHDDCLHRRLSAYAGHLLEHWTPASAQSRGGQRSSGPLSRRECAILRLIGQGYSNKEIGLALGIAFETVKSHAKNIYNKLGAANRAEAVVRAERLGFL